ncbi:MAG: TetR/AcrR family transcriptional regulator [Pseudomonadota bacterium]
MVIPSTSARHAAAGNGARLRILAAAKDAFIAGGGAFEMNDVAQRADVSNGLAYHYFGSKAGLLAALVADFYDRYDAAVNQRFGDETDWVTREIRRVRATVDFLYDEPIAPVMLGKISGSAEVVAAEAARQDAMIELAVRNFTQARKQGAIAVDGDIEITAAVVIGGVRQAAVRALTAARRPPREVLAQQLWTFIAAVVGVSR